MTFKQYIEVLPLVVHCLSKIEERTEKTVLTFCFLVSCHTAPAAAVSAKGIVRIRENLQI